MFLLFSLFWIKLLYLCFYINRSEKCMLSFQRPFGRILIISPGSWHQLPAAGRTLQIRIIKHMLLQLQTTPPPPPKKTPTTKKQVGLYQAEEWCFETSLDILSPRQSFSFVYINTWIQSLLVFPSFKQRICHRKDFVPDSTFLFVLTVMQCYLIDQDRKLVF